MRSASGIINRVNMRRRRHIFIPAITSVPFGKCSPAAGTVVARYDYDPYGRSTTVLGTTPTDFNYTGLYRHSKSNLDLAIHRAYDPDLGRWLNRDPIEEAGGINLYAYVGNDSTNKIDPDGLCRVGDRKTSVIQVPRFALHFYGIL